MYKAQQVVPPIEINKIIGTNYQALNRKLSPYTAVGKGKSIEGKSPLPFGMKPWL